LLFVWHGAGCESPEPPAPAAAGGGFPSFVSGDECLFCHREKVGTSWQADRHNRTIRPALPEEPAVRALTGHPEVEFLLGAADRAHYLKSSGYGRLALLSVAWREGRLTDPAVPDWDPSKFQRSCAGCHTTAYDPVEERFAVRSLDCFVCHGDVPLEHAREPVKALLARGRADSPRTIASICGRCHLRGGASFPDRFVPGDDLFAAVRIDGSDATLGRADRHVLHNVRDIVERGEASVTCLSCHRIHDPAAARHAAVPAGPICAICHPGGRVKEPAYPPDRRSPICEP
jgi:hypothetical protein